MQTPFLSLLNISITASWLVLVVVVLRFVFRKAPKWVFCLLWGMVAIRLICPVSLESNLSLIPTEHTIQADYYVPQPYFESVPDVDTPISVYVGENYTDGLVVAEDQFWNAAAILDAVWLVGMVLMQVYCGISFLRFRRRVATATLLEGNIRQCETVDSPFVLGFFRPVIYLPYDMDEEDRSHVIAHERAHIRRKDHWWKPLGFLVLSVYWFNPVLWIAYALLCRDIEAACDEKVIAQMDGDARRAYSTALLHCSIHRSSIAACPLAFGEVGVKARIQSVMHYKKPAFWLILIAVLLCVVVAVCFLTNPNDEIRRHCEGGEIVKWYVGESIQKDNVHVYEMTAEAFPDAVFVGTDHCIYALENGKKQELIQEMAIHNAYFADLTGDGKPEICASLDFGSGIRDEYVVVYDYAAGERFELHDREYHYKLLDAVDGQLLCKGESHRSDGVEIQGRLVILPVDGEDSGRLTLLAEADEPPLIETDSGVHPSSAREEQITAAILKHNTGEKSAGNIQTESHMILAEKVTDRNLLDSNGSRTETVYLLVLYQEYETVSGRLEKESGSYGPVAITFHVDNAGNYTLQEYWTPRDGSYYADDIRQKFPFMAELMALNQQAYIDELEAECLAKAELEIQANPILKVRIEEVEDFGIQWDRLEFTTDLPDDIELPLQPIETVEQALALAQSIINQVNLKGFMLDYSLVNMRHSMKDDTWIFEYSMGTDPMDISIFCVRIDGTTGEILAAWQSRIVSSE